ncbi:MAG TPA: GntR family transcriptional regulator [Anaerolineaceae bacterium]|jgi:DNA-binding GntR family transcriptional regulator|nr:GntR family transcriptional regulator [Anaerolineaceae bacterium]
MTVSLAGQVYEALKKDIITCALKPGQQIAQQQLAERYGVGITPVREALQKLTREGLILTIPRFGYLVTTITISDVAEIFELRAILESAAARLAATRASDEQIRQLAELAGYTYVYQDRDSYTDFLAHNREFHIALANASGNKRLIEAISHLMDELTRMFHLGLDLKDSAAEMRQEHQELVAVIHQKNPEAAEKIMLAQITHSRQRIYDALLPGASSSPDQIRANIQLLQS